MSRRLLFSVALVAILAFNLVGTAQASPEKLAVSSCSTFPAQIGNPLSPIYMICMPEAVPWNHQVVIFAHGYVPNITAAPVLPVNQIIIDGVSLSDTVNSMGYAFAMTSYPTNGLAIVPGVQDVLNLVQTFKQAHAGTTNVFLTGASEGGLVTTLALEQYPAVFKGGLAVCGPIGNFQNQVNHFGDFRVLFDYFFPGILPVSGAPAFYSAINIPAALAQDWYANPTKYHDLIAAAFASNPAAMKELFQVAKVPVDLANPANTAEELLWYNVFATMDARAKLSADPLNPQPLLNPYSNTGRWYFGSANDFLLNRSVPRFASTVPAATLNQYQTSGRLASPLVTMHTTGDPTVPYSHETLYSLKTLQTGSFFKRVNIPISRYGHCAFQAKEVVFGFSLMVLKATGSLPLSLLTALADGGPAPLLTEQEFYQMQKDLGPKEIYIPMIQQ